MLCGGKLIDGDGIGYYAYLPAVFIKHSLDMNFISPDYLQVTQLYKSLDKWPIGTAIFISPFFTILHAFMRSIYPKLANGYFISYQIMVGFSAVFWWGVGICTIYKTLIKKSKNILRLLSVLQ